MANITPFKHSSTLFLTSLASCELGNEDANDEGTVIDAESEVKLLNKFIGVRVPSTLYSFLLGIMFAMYDTYVRAVEGGAT